MPLSLADFNLAPEQVEFRDTRRRFFEANAPIAEAMLTRNTSIIVCCCWKPIAASA